MERARQFLRPLAVLNSLVLLGLFVASSTGLVFMLGTKSNRMFVPVRDVADTPPAGAKPSPQVPPANMNAGNRVAPPPDGSTPQPPADPVPVLVVDDGRVVPYPAARPAWANATGPGEPHP